MDNLITLNSYFKVTNKFVLINYFIKEYVVHKKKNFISVFIIANFNKISYYLLDTKL